MLAAVINNYQYLNPFKKKIGYIGWLGYENLGDEILLDAFKKVFSKYAVLPYKRTNKTIAMERFLKRKIFVANFLGGGTLINEASFLDDFSSAQKYYQNNFIFGAGVNNEQPQKNRLEDWKESLESCRYIGVRGPLSQESLKKIGIASQVIGDPAIQFADATVVAKSKTKTLGINIGCMNGRLYGRDSDVSFFCRTFVETMMERQWRLKFFCVYQKDWDFFNESLKGLVDPKEIIFHTTWSEDLMTQLRSCDVFVGEKLHAVILALCTYTPSVMLEYLPKCRDFMASFQMEQWCLRTDQLYLDRLIDLVDDLYVHSQVHQQNIQRQIDKYLKLQYEASQQILKHISA